jgi:hypothetical protein
VSDVAPNFLRRWVVVVTIGEWLGFAAPATVGALLFDAAGAVLLPSLLAAGVVEGLLLGAAQWLVLRSNLPRLSLARWAGLTAVGAAVAYAVGLLPSTLYETWSAWSAASQVVFFVVIGSILLAAIGTAQWVELRRHVPGSRRWIVGTAGAWAAALAAFGMISTPLWQEGQSVTLRVLIGVFAGLVMAVVMALVTGIVMRILLRERSPQPDDVVAWSRRR